MHKPPRLPSPPRQLTARQLAALGKRLHTDAGMAEFMDATFGTAGWAFDAHAGLWVAPDPSHTGPGRGFYVVQRGGDWRSVVLPEAVLS